MTGNARRAIRTGERWLTPYRARMLAESRAHKDLNEPGEGRSCPSCGEDWHQLTRAGCAGEPA